MRAVQEDYYLMDRGRIDLLFCKVKVRAWLSQLQDKSWKLARTLKYRSESQVIGDSPTMLFLYYPNAIAESQLYLFHLHRKELLKSFGLTFKALPISVLPRIRVSDPSNLKLIAVQAHFHIEPNDLMDMFDQIKSIGSVAKIIFLDWFATSDLRLFSTIDPFIDRYVKKTVFTDTSQGTSREKMFESMLGKSSCTKALITKVSEGVIRGEGAEIGSQSTYGASALKYLLKIEARGVFNVPLNATGTAIRLDNWNSASNVVDIVVHVGFEP